MPAARVADRSPASAFHHHNSTASPSSPPLIKSSHPPPSFVDPTVDNRHQHSAALFFDHKMEPAPSVANLLVKSEQELAQEKEIGKMVLEQKERLEDELVQRLEELKKLCIAEGELTGQLPEEIYKTLLPGEPEPHVKVRVGTAFKIPQELIQPGQNNDADDIGQLEAEIALNRRIVEAAERLANDRSANKSVRKKRRKDWQAATLRLRGLEKGLTRIRCLSSSKVSLMDHASTIGKSGVAHAGSGFSLNSLRNWPNFYNSIRITTKSCPSTPRGSVPDLTASNGMPSAAAGRKQTPTTTKKLHNLLKSQNQTATAALKSSTTITSSADSASSSGGCPSSSSSSSLSLLLNNNAIGSSHKNQQSISATTSTSSGISSAMANGGCSLASSTSNLLSAPPVPNRRSSTSGSTNMRRPTPPRQRRSASRDRGMDRDPGSISKSREDLACHLYANIGYTTSAPYKSAYRQSNFPTLQSPNRSPPQYSISTSFSANKPIPVYFNDQSMLLANPAVAAGPNEMGQSVRQLDSGGHYCPSSSPLLLLQCKPAGPPPSLASLSSSALPSHVQRLSSFSTTTSLDRRAMKSAAANVGSRFTTHQQQQQYCRRIVESPPKDKSPSPHQQQQPSTTFPVNETFRPLQAADFARFRSISAVLDHQKKINVHQQKPSPHVRELPPKDERMEALLASIHQQQHGGGTRRAHTRESSPAPNGRGGGDGTATIV